MPTQYEPDIAEAEKRIGSVVPFKGKRHGIAVVLALASWAKAGDEWAATELEKHVSDQIVIAIINDLELLDFSCKTKQGAEAAMALLHCRSRQRVITDMLKEMQ